jgi:hypothetical protein
VKSEAIRGQVDQAMRDIRTVERKGHYPGLVVERDEVVALTKGRGAPQARRVVLSFGPAHARCYSYLYVTGYRNHFLKIRFTCWGAAGKNREQRVGRLTGWLAREMQRRPTPAERKEQIP